MAEQADVFVKNNFVTEDITVKRILPDEIVTTTTIGYGGEVKFPLLVPEESLIIIQPEGKNPEEWALKVRSSIIDLAVSPSSNQWRVRIIPNELPPEVPTTVNVTVGDPVEG